MCGSTHSWLIYEYTYENYLFDWLSLRLLYLLPPSGVYILRNVVDGVQNIYD